MPESYLDFKNAVISNNMGHNETAIKLISGRQSILPGAVVKMCSRDGIRLAAGNFISKPSAGFSDEIGNHSN